MPLCCHTGRCTHAVGMRMLSLRASGHMTKQPPPTAAHVTPALDRAEFSTLTKQGWAASGWPAGNSTASPVIDPFRESLWFHSNPRGRVCHENSKKKKHTQTVVYPAAFCLNVSAVGGSDVAMRGWKQQDDSLRWFLPRLAAPVGHREQRRGWT